MNAKVLLELLVYLVAFAMLVDCGIKTEQGVGTLIIFSLFQLLGRGGG